MNLIPILDRLLLAKDPASPGLFAPDERDLLICICISPRLRHLLRTIRPGLGDATFRSFDEGIRDARFLPIHTIQAPHFTPVHDPHRLATLAGRFGGHGTQLQVNINPDDHSASHHDVAYYGSMAAVWHYIRSWVHPLLGRQLAHRPAGCGAYQNHIFHAFDRIMTSFTAVGLHAHQDLLPINSHFPQLHSRLDDGRLSPATVPLGGAPRLDFDDSFDSPSFIFDLDSFDSACHPHAHRAASAVVESLAFLSLYDDLHTTPTGRARLLDGSNSRGPFSWLRRLPIPTLDACETPFFAFTNPEHFPIALALDLLLPPPTQGRGLITACSACATVAHPGGKPLAGPGDRHFVACPHGLKLHSTAHDPTVQALVPFLDAILGSSRVTAERGGLGGQRAVDQWMQGAGAAVDHAPDIILRDFDKAGTYLLIDIKTLDAAGPSHIAANHTDRARLAAHLATATHSRRHQYGILPPNMRLVILAVSTCGAINPEGHTFISSLAQRMDNSIPPVLLHQASWATPKLGPMIRMALGFAVRRGLAAAVHRWWRHVPSPPSPMLVLLPPPLPPPPPPPPPRRFQLDDDLTDEVELLSDSDES